MAETITVSTDETPTVTSETTAEAIAEAAIEVAQIEADRDVAIAEIHAEVASEQSEAIVEAAEIAAEDEDEEIEEGIEQCLQNIETLRTEHQELRAELSSIRSLLEKEQPPPPSLEQVESVVEDLPVAEEAPPAPPKSTPKRLWI